MIQTIDELLAHPNGPADLHSCLILTETRRPARMRGTGAEGAAGRSLNSSEASSLVLLSQALCTGGIDTALFDLSAKQRRKSMAPNQRPGFMDNHIQISQ